MLWGRLWAKGADRDCRSAGPRASGPDLGGSPYASNTYLEPAGYQGYRCHQTKRLVCSNRWVVVILCVFCIAIRFDYGLYKRMMNGFADNAKTYKGSGAYSSYTYTPQQ